MIKTMRKGSYQGESGSEIEYERGEKRKKMRIYPLMSWIF